MPKFVKLSEGASMFYDPSLKIKVLPGQVVELPKAYQRSAHLMGRIRNGHLQYATEAEFEAMGAKEEATGQASIDTDDEVDFSEMKKQQLIEYALEHTEYTENELKAMTKAEIIEVLEELDDEDEDEVE